MRVWTHLVGLTLLGIVARSATAQTAPAKPADSNPLAGANQSSGTNQSASDSYGKLASGPSDVGAGLHLSGDLTVYLQLQAPAFAGNGMEAGAVVPTAAVVIPSNSYFSRTSRSAGSWLGKKDALGIGAVSFDGWLKFGTLVGRDFIASPLDITGVGPLASGKGAAPATISLMKNSFTLLSDNIQPLLKLNSAVSPLSVDGGLDLGLNDADAPSAVVVADGTVVFDQPYIYAIGGDISIDDFSARSIAITPENFATPNNPPPLTAARSASAQMLVPIPEPSAVLLLVAGAGLLGMRRPLTKR